MKTIFKSILFTIAIVAVSLFAGCIPKYEPLNKNDINNYKTQHVYDCFIASYNANCINEKDKLSVTESIDIYDYFGKYNGYAVLLLKYAEYSPVFDPSDYKKIYIGGISLGVHHFIYDFYIFNENETDMEKTFMLLQDAYSEGLISRDNLKQIVIMLNTDKKTPPRS